MSNDIVLQLDPSRHNGRNSEATFVTLRSGRVLLAWSRFNSSDHSDFGSCEIAFRFSDDGGRTWSRRDEQMVPNEGSTNVMSPSLLRLKDGRIGLLTLRKDGGHICKPWFRYSTNEAKSFSKPVCVSLVDGYYVINNDRMVQLRNGRIILPVAMHRMRTPHSRAREKELPGDTKTRIPKSMEPIFSGPGLIFFYFSDDGGRTWFESLTNYYWCTPEGLGLQEPGVIQLKDGRLWSWTRPGLIGVEGMHDCQWESYSKDHGQVWSPPRPTRFISPSSPMQVKRIPKTGHLLAVWNDTSGRFKTPKAKPISWGRTPLVSAISTNEGRTWKHHLLLEAAPDHGFCYPAVHFTNEAALLSYNAGGASSLDPLDTQRVRRITYDALYA